MGIDSDLDLNNDLKYIKNTINKYTNSFKKFEKKLSLTNKVYARRLYFIKLQFENIFNLNIWN